MFRYDIAGDFHAGWAPGSKGIGFLIAAFLILAGQGAASAVPAANARIAGAGAAWLPFDRTDNGLMFVTVTLDGERVQALVDTGFPRTTISAAFAAAHHLKLQSSRTEVSVGGSAAVGTTTVGAMDVGGTRFPPGMADVSDLSAVSQAAGRNVDIVVGASALTINALQVDEDGSRLRLIPSGVSIHGMQRVPVRWEGVNRLMTALRIGMRSFAHIMIDTGADSEILLTNEASPSLRGMPGLADTDIAAAGAGGIVVFQLATVRRAHLGPVEAHDLAVTFEARGNFLTSAGAEGLIGMGMLARYNFVLDPAAGLLALSERSTPPATHPKSTIGVQALPGPDRLRILHVMRNSPAAAAGLREGQDICSVNGQRVDAAWAGSAMAHWGTSAPGTSFKVDLCDGKTVAVTAEAFY